MKFGVLYTYNIWLFGLPDIRKNDDFIVHLLSNKFKNQPADAYSQQSFQPLEL